MRSAAFPLPSLEITIGRRRAALSRAEHVGVHAEAHRAAGVAPFESGIAKHAVESFLLRLRFDALRSGHDHRARARRDVPAPDDAGCRAQILDPRVRARAEEHAI